MPRLEGGSVFDGDGVGPSGTVAPIGRIRRRHNGRRSVPAASSSTPHRLNSTDDPPDRGMSPVLGMLLMVGIVMMLAAIVGSMILGVGDVLNEPAPASGFDRQYVATAPDNDEHRPYVEITHEIGRTVDGDRIVIKDESGNTVKWSDVWTAGPKVEAGEYVHIDGFGSDGALDPICAEGDTYWIILQDEDGDALIVNEWEAPRDPKLPEGSSWDDDGDGIPNWC